MHTASLSSPPYLWTTATDYVIYQTFWYYLETLARHLRPPHSLFSTTKSHATPSRYSISVGLCTPFMEDTLLPPSYLKICPSVSALHATHKKQDAHSSRNSHRAITSSAAPTTCCIKSGRKGDASVINCYLIHSPCLQTSETSTTFWQIQAAIISQLHLIHSLLIIIAIIHPDQDGHTVKNVLYKAQLKQLDTLFHGCSISSTGRHYLACVASSLPSTLPALHVLNQCC